MSHLTGMIFVSNIFWWIFHSLNLKTFVTNVTFDWDDFRVRYFLMNFPLTFLYMIYFQDFVSFQNIFKFSAFCWNPGVFFSIYLLNYVEFFDVISSEVPTQLLFLCKSSVVRKARSNQGQEKSFEMWTRCECHVNAKDISLLHFMIFQVKAWCSLK